MRKFQQMLGIAIFVALASQFNIGLLESSFVVSAGIIIFVIFLYNYDDISPVYMGILSGIMVYLMRLAAYQITLSKGNEVIISYMPEIIFYIFYSILYKVLLNNGKKDRLGFALIALILCDFTSNFIEGFLRFFILKEIDLIKVIPSLLLVSFVRSTIVWIALVLFNYYNMMLRKREHEERYKRLLYLTSQLKTEIFWIEKNMDNIEKVMVESYELYEQISNKQNSENWANKALNIARDVHEIKKENGLIVRGIKSITENKLKDKGMEYKDISNILLETMKREAKNINKNIKIEFIVGENFYTGKHYYLMSVLRNLIMNSMDAIKEGQLDGKIIMVHRVENTDHIFQIGDNGEGICENDIKNIFSPGFSTKINYETGVINRGLGLSIVKHIVEEELKGNIEVKSILGKGTTFIISIPRKLLEEKLHENINSWW